MSKRVVMRLEINPRSKQRLDEFCDRNGMTKVAVVSRLIDWFCSREPSIQAVIQELYPREIEDEIVEIILRRMNKEKRAASNSGKAGDLERLIERSMEGNISRRRQISDHTGIRKIA
jgi:hypothetical protein